METINKAYLKVERKGDIKVKFKKGDMILHLPTSGLSAGGDSVMYVMDYDEKRKNINV